MRGIGTDMVCTLVPDPISELSNLQMPLNHRKTSAYNWDLGINVPVKLTNDPIIIKYVNYATKAFFLKNGKIMSVFSNYAKYMLAQSIRAYT